MMTCKLTKHGQQRINQRGFKREDLDLVRRCGIQLDDRSAEVYFLRDKDVEDGIKNLKRQIQNLERMRGCKVVFNSDNDLITAHHTTRETQKKLLRRPH